MATPDEVLALLGLHGLQDAWIVEWIKTLCDSQSPADSVAACITLRMTYLALAKSVDDAGFQLSEQEWLPWLRRLALGENSQRLLKEICAVYCRKIGSAGKVAELRAFWKAFIATMVHLSLRGIAVTPEIISRVIDWIAGGGDPRLIAELLAAEAPSANAVATP